MKLFEWINSDFVMYVDRLIDIMYKNEFSFKSSTNIFNCNQKQGNDFS